MAITAAKGGKGRRVSKRASRGAVQRGRAGDVNRYVCSALYFVPAFADYAYWQLAEPSLQAICPAYGVDLVAVARHAAVARRRNRILDVNLVLLLLAVVAGASGVAAAAAEARQATPGIVAAGATVLAVAVFAPRILLLITVLARFRRVHALFNPARTPRDLANPVDKAVEAELDAAENGNAVAFSESGNPFVGSGEELGGWHLGVDTTRPATDSKGNLRTVTPFTSVDVHKAITVAIRQSGVPGIEVHNRLYIGGVAAGHIPDLLPDPYQRPSPMVPSQVIKLGIEKPRSFGRTFLCVQRTSRDGELIVTVFVRAEVEGNDLFVESHTYVLLPLRPEIRLADLMPDTKYQIFHYVWRKAKDARGGLLLGSPGRLLRNRRRRWKQWRQEIRERRNVRLGGVVDYGALTSIREDVGSEERVSLFDYSDEKKYVTVIERRVLDCISRFLDAHGVDTSEFTSKQQTIVNKGDTYNFDKVLGGSHAFGSGSSVSNSSNNAGSPAPNASASAPWNRP